MQKIAIVLKMIHESKSCSWTASKLELERIKFIHDVFICWHHDRIWFKERYQKPSILEQFKLIKTGVSLAARKLVQLPQDLTL